MKIKEVIPKKINLDNNKANVYNYVTVLQVKESITVLSRNVDRVFQKGKRAILSIWSHVKSFSYNKPIFTLGVP